MKETISTKNNKKDIIEVDPWLNKYSNLVLCPEKVEKARQTIEKFGLPDLQKLK